MADSEPPKTLAEALVTLQARLPRVAKTADAQYGKYADLTMVSEALLPLLASLGLSFTARPTLSGGDRFVLLYALTHVSGEEILGEYPLPTSGSPQQIGSAITYARRYSLCAVTGLAPGGDDDDGQAGEQGHAAGQRKPRNVPDSDLAASGRMTRAQKAGHERLAADTRRGGKAERSHPRGPDPDDPWAQDAPVDHQRAAAIRESVDRAREDVDGGYIGDLEDRPGSSNPGQWQQLGILYKQLGILAKETRLEEMTDRVGREITSAKDLSYAEAEQAIRELRELAAEMSEKGAD